MHVKYLALPSRTCGSDGTLVSHGKSTPGGLSVLNVIYCGQKLPIVSKGRLVVLEAVGEVLGREEAQEAIGFPFGEMGLLKNELRKFEDWAAWEGSPIDVVGARRRGSILMYKIAVFIALAS